MCPIQNICEDTIIELLNRTNNKTINIPTISLQSNISLKTTGENNIIPNPPWHFLVFNKSTGLKISTLISKSSLISKNIIEIQFIESTNRNQKEKFPAVYFIDLTKDTLKLLEKDLKGGVYKETRIIIGNIPSLILKNKRRGKYIEYEESLLKKLQKISLNEKYRIKNIESIQLGFKYKFFNLISQEDCFYSSIISFIDFINISSDFKENKKIFAPNFIEHKSDENIKKLFSSYNYAEEYPNYKQHNIDVIRIDRSFDYITPLMYFFTFYPLLDNIGLINELQIEGENLSLKENSEFKVFRFKHLAEVTTLIPKRLDALITKTNQIDETTNTSELARMVLEAPILLKQKQETELLISLVEKCINVFKSELTKLGEIQNLIILSEKGTKINKEKFNVKKEKVLKILTNFLKENSLSKKNEQKLILIYFLKYFVYCDFTKEELIEDLMTFKMYFQETEISNLKKFLVKNLNFDNFKKSDLFDKNYDFDVSTVRPRLEIILLEFLKEGKINNFVGQGIVTDSLRKGGFLNKKSPEKRKILVSLDWVCAKELEVCEVLSNQFNVDIIVIAKFYSPEQALDFILQ